MKTLIAGGGLAGAAAACLLGSDATLIERETGPHDKICGEFISWEAQELLAALGVDPAELGGAPIHNVRLVHRDKVVTARLPGRGIGLSRRILDEAVLQQAVRNGATIMRGRTVRRVVPHGLEIDGLGTLTADRTLLATGKHDLRNARRGGKPEQLVGLKMFYRLSPAQSSQLADHVEIVLFPGGYAGLQPVENGLANLCLLIDRTRFRSANANWPGVLNHLMQTSHYLATRLAAAEPQLDQPAAIFRIPYGFVHASGAGDPIDLFRLGDQMAVIPSFSGDGMAIALYTAKSAVSAPDAQIYHYRMNKHLRPQVSRAMMLHRLGQSHPGLLSLAARALPSALPWIARLTRVARHAGSA